MKVIILAAGKGSRLGASDLPKPLTKLAMGKSILEYQLEGIKQYTSLNNVMVVVGYCQEKIIQAFPKLSFIHNPNYASENTSKSLLRAIKKCEEDILWLNGDVIFHPSILKKILENPKTAMIVNVGSVGKEEVKYRQNEQNKILEVSKFVKDPQGEALGINYCSFSDLNHFKNNLELCLPSDYFERGLELCIQEGMAVWSVPVQQNLCIEVDFLEDLEKANKLLSTWS